METTLLDLTQNYFIGSTVWQLSTAFDEPTAALTSALPSIVPLAISGVVAYAQRLGGAAELASLAQQIYHQNLLGDLRDLLQRLPRDPSAASDGSSREAAMMRSLLGSDYPAVVASLSQQTGVHPVTISNLLSVAVAVGVGLVGRQAAQQHLDTAGLVRYLASQHASIWEAATSLPAELSSTLTDLLQGVVRATPPPLSEAPAARVTMRPVGSLQAGTEPSATHRADGLGVGQATALSTGPTPLAAPRTPAGTSAALDTPASTGSPLPGEFVPPATRHSAVRPPAAGAAPFGRWAGLLVVLGLALLGYLGWRFFGQPSQAGPLTQPSVSTRGPTRVGTENPAKEI